MADISLTASMRSNLLALQNTQSFMDMTQERLSTGKKVNSAIDNPSSYYTAQSLTNRAGDLEALLDSMGQGIQTIKAANEGIESITSFVEQAKAVANTARDTTVSTEVRATGTYVPLAQDDTVTVKVGDKTFTYTATGAVADIDALVDALNGDTVSGLDAALADANLTFANDDSDGNDHLVLQALDPDEPVAKTVITLSGGGLEMSGTINPNARDTYVEQFNTILEQIDQLANDASYKGVNLLKKDDLKVVFNEDRSSFWEVKGDNATSAGLELTKQTNWDTNTAVDQVITSVDAAISKLRDMATKFGNNYSIVQTRQDFTENLVNVLEEGSDNLILADMNEESANMLALQTRQQLGTNSLSLASQAAQSVLRLF